MEIELTEREIELIYFTLNFTLNSTLDDSSLEQSEFDEISKVRDKFILMR